MEFKKYIAIDWSGANNRRPTDAIQIAEYVPQTQHVSIVRSCTQSPTGWNIWSREAVLHYVQREIKKGKVLIGFDFAFGYPYCDKDAYFPELDASPGNAPNLWETVDTFCRADADFYGGKFYRSGGSCFKRYYKYNGFEGDRYAPRLRITDRRARRSPRVDPFSVFSCYGQKNVGTGSLAGMRFLHRLQQDLNVDIWPFDMTDPPNRSTVVEIYPRFFLSHAEERHVNQPTPGTVRELLGIYGAILTDVCEKWSDHERDALVSAAGMGWFASQQETWKAPRCACTCVATHEGWMFGVW